MPRRAIELIENEIRSLSRRIDENRQSGTDGQALAGIERALGEIHEVLRSLTPAEQLAGYDEAIRNLGAKLDLILRANDDPVDRASARRRDRRASLDRLQRRLQRRAGAAFRRRAHAVGQGRPAVAPRRPRRFLRHARAAHRRADLDAGKPRAAGRKRQFRTDRRRAARAVRTPRPHAGRQRQRVGVCPSRTARVVSAGTAGSFRDRSRSLRRSRPGRGRAAGHSALISNASTPIWSRIADSTRNAARRAPQPMDSGLVDIVKRELSDIRFSQSETDRRTQDSLETVHNTLGHVVDRLAMIEGDLRAVRAAPPAPQPIAAPAPAVRVARGSAARRDAVRRTAGLYARAHRRPSRRSRNPNCRIPPRRRSILPPRRANSMPRSAAWRRPSPPMPPRAISEILEPHAAPPRTAIAPELPPDHPLEPGTRPAGRVSSPSERIAASESAISEIPRPPRRAGQFVELHRRRAPCRAGRRRRARQREGGAAPQRRPPPRPRPATRPRQRARLAAQEPSTITSKIRSLLVGASVVVIVLGTFKMAMTLLDTGSAPPMPPMENSSRARMRRRRRPPRTAPSPRRRHPAGALDDVADPDRPAIATTHPAPNTLDSRAGRDPADAAASLITASDVTGAIPTAPRRRQARDGAGPAERAAAGRASADRCCAPPR